jgi:hypothetical protein
MKQLQQRRGQGIVVEPHGHLVRLVRRVCRRDTDIQVLFTHSIEPWMRSRTPILPVCSRLLLRVLLAFWLTFIPPQYGTARRTLQSGNSLFGCLLCQANEACAILRD